MAMALLGRVMGRSQAWVGAVGALAALMVGGGVARGQGVAGGPSIPLTAVAQANGVQNRITYQYGTEFVTIGTAGNAAYERPGGATGGAAGAVHGRGSVGYEYRIGRYEVTTSQWVAFMNAAYDRPSTQNIPFLTSSLTWGAVSDPTYTGPGRRWVVPAGNENRAVGNISWRMAAIYCNWLHNDQSTDRNAFLNGAYDVSTFGYFGNIFTDQVTHNANARFWIPTWDEWLKAVHFDPSKNNGQGGWWTQPNASDTALVYGPPSNPLAQANAGYIGPVNPFAVPLGAYPTVQSPWGLIDAAGGTWEWNETVFTVNTGQNYRGTDGSAWTQTTFGDSISSYGSDFPSISQALFGLRIAAAVPSPSTAVVVAGFVLLGSRRRRLLEPDGRMNRAEQTLPGRH